MAPRARPCVLLAAAVLLAAVHSGNFLLPRWPRCSSSIPRRSRASCADEDNAQGVWWMALNSSEALEAEDRCVELPVFPLSGAYFPFSEMELSIFEPRYRQLYNDILVSGGRRFVVVAPRPEEERVAEVGVVFYLDELTDVSEESGDEVKYICNHRIIERVRLRRILNPSAWKDASTYLRAEVEPFEDDDLLEDAKEQQEEVMALLTRLASRQEEMGGPHFESHISDYANASCAEQGGLWTLADVFAEYFEFLQSEKEQNLDIDIEQVYRKYNLEDQDDDNAGTAPFDEDVKDAPGGAPMSSYEPYEDDYEYEEVDLMELPSYARSELWRLQEQFEEEASVLNDDLMLFVHQMLQSRSHAERLKIMQRALLQEERRLAARKALQSVMLSIGSKEDERAKPWSELD